MSDRVLEEILMEYIRLYGLTDAARQYFIDNPSKEVDTNAAGIAPTASAPKR